MTLALVGSTDRQLEELLRACGAPPSLVPAADLAALAARPSSPAPDVVVLDLRDQAELPAALSAFKKHHPSTGVVIVAGRLDPALMLEAMRAGANEWVVEPLTQAELRAALGRVMSQQPIHAGGQLFAFLGAKGGVSTTTVAVNVATVLAEAAPAKALFIDLHQTYGDAAVFFGVEPRFSVVDALENTHRFDEAFFRGLVVRTKAGPDLLASSDRAVVAPADPQRLRALIEFAVQHYRYTVLDVPRSDTAALDALELATTIVIVANQELATVRSASRMATVLGQRYGRDRVAVVMSRTDQLAEIGAPDVERAIGGSVRHAFLSNYRVAIQALNKGRPVVLDNHNTLARSFRTFARDLAGLREDAAAKRSGLFGRFRS